MGHILGIPRERKLAERRVSLTPKGVSYLTQKGIQVLIEKDAGLLSGFKNEDYQQAGGFVTKRNEIWKNSFLIKKVKEPIAEEFSFFKANQIIFTYLHLASPQARLLIDALIKSKTTAIAYETIEKDQDTPLLRPMSEVAGTLAAYYGAVFERFIRVEQGQIHGLEVAKAEIERVVFQYPLVPEYLRYRGKVVVLGGGHVGEKSALMAAKMGADVFVSEISQERKIFLENQFSKQNLTIKLINPLQSEEYTGHLTSANVIIASVHAPGKRAPMVIDEALLSQISRLNHKIILDIAIDQGGNVAQSYPVDYEKLLYLDRYRNLRFSVTNVPSLCGPGASATLESNSLLYTEALLNGLNVAVEKYPELKGGINVLGGKVVHPAVCEAHNIR